MAEGDAPAGAGNEAGNGDAGKTFTQEELNRVVGERLAKERAKFEGFDDLKAKASEYDKLKAAQQSETERLSNERDTHKTAAQQAAAENLRLRVAMEKKLPASLIDRLQGGTKEEMEADADKLLELVAPTPNFDGGTRQGDTPADMNQMIRQAAGRS